MQDTFAGPSARATIGYLVDNSSIYMRASYEELGKSKKKWEKVMHLSS